MAEDPYTACAQLLAATPQLVRRLIADHSPDPAGWCRAHAAHGERHPCSIRMLADLAHAHAAERGPQGREQPV